MGDCKKAVYYFLKECKEELGLRDDELFSISGLYKDDTNEFVKLVKTVTLLLTMMEERGYLQLRPLPFPLPTIEPADAATDNRSKLIAELLNTERSYNTDLEKLHQYQQDLLNKSNIVPRAVVASIFANLDELLDFERRFLLQMEATMSLAPSEQRIGLLFIQNEEAFRSYVSFCGNYQTATNLAMEKAAMLQQASPEMDPVRGLPNYLIKPVQRICRYPLLLNELIKLSDPETYPYMDELKDGLASIKRVVDVVNEEKRREENQMVREELAERVEDWKGLDVYSFGELLLHDKFPMQSGESEKDYSLFLFEKILLCCKDMGNKNKKKKKTNQEISSYTLKGNIYITSVSDVVDASNPEKQFFLVKVFWRDGPMNMESFALKCRNAEQVKLWKGRLEDLLLRTDQMRKMSLSADSPYGSNTQLNPDIIRPPQSRMTQYSMMEDFDEDYDYDAPNGRVPQPMPPPQPQHRRAQSRADSGYDTNSIGPPQQYYDGAMPPYMQRSKSIPHNYYPPAFQNGGQPPANRKSSPAQPRSLPSEYPPKSPHQRPLSGGPMMNGGRMPSPVPPMPAPYQPGDAYGGGEDYRNGMGGERSASRAGQMPPSSMHMPMPPPPASGFAAGGFVSPRNERPGPPASPLPPTPQNGWQHNRRPSAPSGLRDGYFDFDDDVDQPPMPTPYDPRVGRGLPSPPPSMPGSPHGRRRDQSRAAPPPISTTRMQNMYGGEMPSADPFHGGAPRSPDLVRPVPTQGKYGGEHPPRSTSHHGARVQDMYRSASMPDVIRNGSPGPNSTYQSSSQAPYPSQSSYSQYQAAQNNYHYPPQQYSSASSQQYDEPSQQYDGYDDRYGRDRERDRDRSDRMGNGAGTHRSTYAPPNMPLPPTPSNGGAVPPPMSNLPPQPRRAQTAYPSSTPSQMSSVPPTQSFSGSTVATPTTPLFSPSSATPSTNPSSTSSSSSLPASVIKVKTHFGTDVFVIAVPARGCSFSELSSKIERKIRLCGSHVPEGKKLRMRYRDEDGDFITVNNDDDVALAFESSRGGNGGEKGVVNLFVQ
ncbi:hypothetical protein HK104_011432 [Borealophlyctis nickersoniae]|nr:hypothetical protein HK104_011432 [Borealophlyctis nickersoniae]